MLTYYLGHHNKRYNATGKINLFIGTFTFVPYLL